MFERNWLCVGRIERLPRKGSYFTRDLPGRLASIVIARDLNDTVHAFHNVCAHRGNKVVWQEHPGRESSGTCRAFACKYHGWRYGLDGKVNHITNEGEFFDLDKSTLRMPPVHCEVWAGFIFINLADDPVPLRDFLGDGLLPIEAYPFEKMTQRYGFSTRINGNWKLAVDSVCEWYHPPYVHGRFIDPDVSKAEKMVPPVDAYHYELFRPHMLTSVPDRRRCRPANPAPRDRPARTNVGSTSCSAPACSGPTMFRIIGPQPDFLNRGNIASWGNDQFWLFPNISIQIWARGYYITYTYWPETVDSHIYEIDMYFVPPANAQDRLAQELVVDSTIEFAMQDVNTIEATHSALKTRAQSTFHLSDQELLIRQFHTVIRDTVAAYQAAQREASCPICDCRQGFADLEPFVADWALPTRAQRYEARLSKPYDELVTFYDAIAPRAEEAIAYLNGLDINELPDDADEAAAPALLDDPGLLRRQRVQAEPHPGLRCRFLRHGRRTGGVIDRMTASERPKARDSTTRDMLVDATSQIMVEEGYAAATSRRVAAKAGVKPALVHYYFPTMDELYLAVFRRGAAVYLERQQKALASDRPLHAFWDTLTEPKDTRLLLEFMGLANHRKEIKAEIAAWSERWREQQITALNFIVREHGIDTDEFPPAAIAVVIASIGRTLILEQGLGTKGGHDEAVALVNRFLDRFEMPTPKTRRGRGAADSAPQGSTTRSRSQPRTVDVDASCAVS